MYAVSKTDRFEMKAYNKYANVYERVLERSQTIGVKMQSCVYAWSTYRSLITVL